MLEGIDRWPVANASAAVVTSAGVIETYGDITTVYRLASVTKPLAAYAALIAFEEGIVGLDDAAHGLPAGITLRHLLAHASGLPFEGESPVARPGTRRIYSNTGFDHIGTILESAAQMPLATYLHEAVIAPLGMNTTVLTGRAAAGAYGSVEDLCRFVGELLSPRLISPATAAELRRVQFPGLSGVLPGVGRFDPCDWGLGVELKGTKRPHWMGTRNSPATFGHFGGAGTFLWVDVGAQLSLVALTDRPFDSWADDALRLWPALSDTVLTAVKAGPGE